MTPQVKQEAPKLPTFGYYEGKSGYRYIAIDQGGSFVETIATVNDGLLARRIVDMANYALVFRRASLWRRLRLAFRPFDKEAPDGNA